ncbi:MAG: DUF3667 domain-containing protein [Colwellia sp.]|nr:DUF3667 domain-containing protein [Colwellia sp.]
MSKCLNCKTSLNLKSTYCSICGQPTLNLHQSFMTIAFQALHELLDIDGRLFNTLKILLFSPGRLSKEYTAGRRARYTPPLRMYLVISLLFFVIASMTQTMTSENNLRIAFMLFPVGMLEQVPKLMIVMLPIYALLIQLFNRKSFYVFNLIFALHIHALIYLVLMIILPINHYVDMHVALFWLQYILIGYLAYYLLFALKTMYGKSWLFTIFVYIFTLTLYVSSIGLGLQFIQTFLN